MPYRVQDSRLSGAGCFEGRGAPPWTPEIARGWPLEPEDRGFAGAVTWSQGDRHRWARLRDVVGSRHALRLAAVVQGPGGAAPQPLRSSPKPRNRCRQVGWDRGSSGFEVDSRTPLSGRSRPLSGLPLGGPGQDRIDNQPRRGLLHVKFRAGRWTPPPRFAGRSPPRCLRSSTRSWPSRHPSRSQNPSCAPRAHRHRGLNEQPLLPLKELVHRSRNSVNAEADKPRRTRGATTSHTRRYGEEEQRSGRRGSSAERDAISRAVH